MEFGKADFEIDPCVSIPKFAIGLLLIFSFSKSEAQQKFTINGNVKDARTGEEMFGATVSVKETPTIGTGTNAYGFYSITLPEGNYNIIAQYVGYEPKIINVNLTSNLKQDFLRELIITLLLNYSTKISSKYYYLKDIVLISSNFLPNRIFKRLNRLYNQKKELH